MVFVLNAGAASSALPAFHQLYLLARLTEKILTTLCVRRCTGASIVLELINLRKSGEVLMLVW